MLTHPESFAGIGGTQFLLGVRGPYLNFDSTYARAGWRVEAVCKLHRRLENPLYPRALEVAEEMMRDCIIGGDTSYAEVVEAVKKSSTHSDFSGMAECVVRNLTEKGIRIWK